jgi:tetratricopeptide (TPR) repeat protein
LKLKSDTEEPTKVKSTETLEEINKRIQDQPSADLHLQRLELIDNVVENAILVSESFAWLTEHESTTLEKARAIMNDEINTRLSTLTEWNEESEDDPGDHSLLLLQQLEPLAAYFPVIDLSYGLFLMHCARKHRERQKSPLEILEEILASAEQEKNPNDPRQLTALAKDVITLRQQAYTHLSRAVALLEVENTLRVVALEALAQVCEKLDDLVGAFQAYREAATYNNDFSEKLDELGATIRQQARERLLKYIDQLLAVGKLNEADNLLKQASPVEDNDDFRIRAADLAFLRGDLDDAVEGYESLMD